ncbi:MAG: alpha-2-macroglobulin, partial [Spirochaetia bacterium]|nr:alpha-2-macroglobulin [Spirochaetia bacterium]
EDEETVNRLSSTLLLNRRDFAWNNTRDTASAVLALSERLEKVKDLSGKSIVNIFVNENAAGTVESSPDELFSGKTILDIPVYFLKDKKIKVRFEKVSGPPVYATAILNYKDVSKSFEPENKGFSVKRKYYLVGSETFGSGLKLKESNGNSFQRGDLIMNELSVKRNTGDDRYFMISDPLPPGFSIVRNDHEYYSPDNPVEYNSRQILDNKVVFFVSGPDSEFTIRYFLHADLPGQYSVLPAKSMLMYYPEVYGTTASSTVTIH